jgi:glutamyl endopeptidase
MARGTPKTAKSKSEHASVSNVPEDANRPVKVRAVTPPATLGVNPGAAPTTEAGLEAVKGVKRTEALEAIAEGPATGRAARLFTPPEKRDLRDIGEASFGPPPPLPETVHGPDDRVQITTTGQYPWRAIASLLITAHDNSTWIGTAWFISPRTLITAGHCVFIKDSGVPGRDGWVKKINVMPGRNGNTLPYGSVTSTVFKSVNGWTEDGDENFDYGAIVLPTPLGETVGVFGIGVYPDDELENLAINISGYPGDKPSGTQWFDARVVAQVNARKVYYDIDTAGGQSGAPVVRILDGNRIGIAVHAYGGATSNSGTRINAEVHQRMKSWME